MTRRILIADPLSNHRIALRALLQAAHYDVTVASSGAEAVSAVRVSAPDLILAEVSLPDIDGPNLCTRLREASTGPMPPVLFVGPRPDPQMRLDVLRSGAEDLMFRPLDGNGLLARIRGLLRAHDAAAELRRRDATTDRLSGADGFAEAPPGFRRPGRVAIVAPAGDARARDVATALRRQLPHRIATIDPAEALGIDDPAAAPDVFVLPVDLPGPEDGLPLLSELRSRPATRHAAILALHDGARRDSAGRALDLGAGDVADAEAEVAEIAHRIAVQIQRKRDGDRLRRDDDAMRHLALTDPLTGLHNRRYALDHLETMARGSGAGLAVLMVDIDRFKSVNDTHGHLAGDAVIVQIAARLRESLRAVDMLARVGGEEFLVALPDVTVGTAQDLAERLRRRVAAAPVNVPEAAPITVTVSIGLAMHRPGPEDREPATRITIDQADRALYAAKHAGRNAVRSAGDLRKARRPRGLTAHAPADSAPALVGVAGRMEPLRDLFGHVQQAVRARR